MWEHYETIHSSLWSDGTKETDRVWYYKINKEDRYIINLKWSGECWQVSVSDKETLFTHGFWEIDLNVAKLKALLRAKELGWSINNLSLN